MQSCSCSEREMACCPVVIKSEKGWGLALLSHVVLEGTKCRMYVQAKATWPFCCVLDHTLIHKETHDFVDSFLFRHCLVYYIQTRLYLTLPFRAVLHTTHFVWVLFDSSLLLLC